MGTRSVVLLPRLGFGEPAVSGCVALQVQHQSSVLVAEPRVPSGQTELGVVRSGPLNAFGDSGRRYNAIVRSCLTPQRAQVRSLEACDVKGVLPTIAKLGTFAEVPVLALAKHLKPC